MIMHYNVFGLFDQEIDALLINLCRFSKEINPDAVRVSQNIGNSELKTF
jgi:hypothetical protein